MCPPSFVLFLITVLNLFYYFLFVFINCEKKVYPYVMKINHNFLLVFFNYYYFFPQSMVNIVLRDDFYKEPQLTFILCKFCMLCLLAATYFCLKNSAGLPVCIKVVIVQLELWI